MLFEVYASEKDELEIIMAIIKCKMCGGDIELNEEKTFGTCEYCGSVMTLPKVSDDQRAARFNRGNHFRRQGDFDKALAVYESIVREDDTDAEAHWCCALCRFGIEYVEDPNTFEFLPTCHRASFDSFTEDVDYLAALENSDGITRRQYQKDAVKIAEVQRGILATSQNEEPYDVFICYKETDDSTNERTRDSLDAQDIYYQLTQEGYRVFFSRITLEDKAGAEYEPYIFAALNSAKVMVAIGSKPEYFNAVWVKNEWSRFLAMMRKDRSKLLLPCYKGMDPYDMPEQLGVLQSYDMAKIGFMQDLIRGIKKVLRKDEPKETIKEKVVVQQTGSTNIAPLLKRGILALEDGEWDKANGFFDQALNLNAECADAYVGFLMSELQVRRRQDLQNQAYPFDDRNNFKKAVRFGDDKTKSELNGYITHINTRNKNEIYDRAVNAMKSAKSEDAYKEAAELFSTIPDWKDAEKLEKECLETRKDIMYNFACALQESGEEKKLAKAADVFTKLNDYKDSIERAKACRLVYEEEKATRKEREKRERADTIVRLAQIRAQIAPYRNLIVANCHTVGLNEDGTVVAAGGDERGECDVSKWNNIVAIAVGISRTIGLKADGTVKGVGYFGDNGYRRSDERYRKEKDEIDSWRDIKRIITTDHRIIGLKKDGTVVAVGYNKDGQGYVYDWRDIVAVAASHNHTVGLKSDGTVVAVGDNKNGQCDVTTWRNIVAVSAGYFHTIGLKSDGTVVATKFRSYGSRKDEGQCDVSDWKDIVDVVAGYSFTVGLKTDGTVVATKSRNNVNSWKDIVSIHANNHRIVGIKSDGTVVSKGNNFYGECNVSDWHDIVAVAVGDSRTVGLKSDGTVVTTDSNDDVACNVSGWKLFKTEAEIEAEKETNYKSACAMQESAEEENLKKAIAVFIKLEEYKDSSARAEECRQTYIEKTIAREKAAKIASLNDEKTSLQTELSNLKGIFSGRRRKQIEARLSEIDIELNKL